MKIKVLTILTSFFLVMGTGIVYASSQVNQGASCKNLGKISTVSNTKFKCIKKDKKLTWQKVNSLNPGVKPTYVPRFFPLFLNNAPVENPNRITVAIYNADYVIIDKQKIDKFEFEIRKESSTEWSETITVNVSDSLSTSTGEKYWAAGWTILPATLGENIYSRVRAVSGSLKGAWSESKVVGTVTPTSVTPIAIPSPTPTPVPTPTKVYSDISQRDWQLIVKDPIGNQSRNIVVYGRITQFDSITGLGRMRAEVFGTLEELNKSFSFGDNTFLTGTDSMLKNFVNKDKFKARVTVSGTYSYTTTLNANVTVPLLAISSIELL
jgi:hypothetical protein